MWNFHSRSYYQLTCPQVHKEEDPRHVSSSSSIGWWRPIRQKGWPISSSLTQFVRISFRQSAGVLHKDWTSWLIRGRLIYVKALQCLGQSPAALQRVGQSAATTQKGPEMRWPISRRLFHIRYLADRGIPFVHKMSSLLKNYSSNVFEVGTFGATSSIDNVSSETLEEHKIKLSFHGDNLIRFTVIKLRQNFLHMYAECSPLTGLLLSCDIW